MLKIRRSTQASSVASGAMRPADALEQKIRTANQFVQILAVFAAGAWALVNFWETVWPLRLVGLQPSLQSKVDWSSFLGACRAEVTFTVENVSSRKAEVTAVTYEAKSVLPTRLTSGQSLAELGSAKDLKPAAAGRLPTLEGSYQPKERRFRTILLLIPPDSKFIQEVNITLEAGSAEDAHVATALLEPCSQLPQK